MLLFFVFQKLRHPKQGWLCLTQMYLHFFCQVSMFVLNSTIERKKNLVVRLQCMGHLQFFFTPLIGKFEGVFYQDNNRRLHYVKDYLKEVQIVYRQVFKVKRYDLPLMSY